MEELSLEERVAVLERDLDTTQQFASFLLALTLGRPDVDAEKYRLLRRAYFGRYIDKDKEFAAVNLALKIEEDATEFLAWLEDSEMSATILAGAGKSG